MLVTLEIQVFDGVESVECPPWVSRVDANHFSIDDRNMSLLKGEIASGELDYLNPVFLRRIVGAINAHSRSQGWRHPDPRLINTVTKQRADEVFEAVRYNWQSINCLLGVQVRYPSGDIETFNFPYKPRRDAFGLVDFELCLGEPWKDTSSYACLDHLFSHGH
jgi:hypothetical protein